MSEYEMCLELQSIAEAHARRLRFIENRLKALESKVGTMKCPKCGSGRYLWTYDFPNEQPEDGNYICLDCGHEEKLKDGEKDD